MKIKPVDSVYFGAHLPSKQHDAKEHKMEKEFMKQYWMKIKYNVSVRCDNPLWTLTRGAFKGVEAVYKAYEHQAVAMGYEILEVKARD